RSGGENTSIVFAGSNNDHILVRRARIENCNVAIWSRARNDGRTLTITDSTFRCPLNVQFSPFNTVGMAFTLTNCRFGNPLGVTAVTDFYPEAAEVTLAPH